MTSTCVARCIIVRSGAVNKLLFDGYYAKSEGPLNNNHPAIWDGAGKMYKLDRKGEGLLDRRAGRLVAGKPIREASGVAGVADGTPLRSATTCSITRRSARPPGQIRKAGIDLAVEVVPARSSSIACASVISN